MLSNQIKEKLPLKKSEQIHITNIANADAKERDGKALEMLLGLTAVGGFLGLFITAFDVEWNLFTGFICLLALAATAFFTDANKNPTVAAVVNTAVFIMLAVMVLIFHDRIWNGITMLLNQVITSINASMDYTWHTFVVNGSAKAQQLDLQIVMGIMAVVVSFFAALIIREADFLLSIVLELPLLALALYFACEPHWAVILVCICGISGIWAMAASKKMANLSTVAIAVLCCLLCFGIPMAYLLLADYQPVEEVSSLKKRITDEGKSRYYGSDALPQGDFTKAGEHKASEDGRLSIKRSLNVPIYLKGYVGSVYTKDGWEELDNKAYTGENIAMFDYFEENNFHPEYQIAQYLSLNQEYIGAADNTAVVDIEIETKEANSRYFYTPANITADSAEKLNAKFYRDYTLQAPFPERAETYSYQAIAPLNGQLNELSVAAWTVMDFEKDDSFDKFLRSERVYRNFVYNNYLTVPDHIKELLESTDLSAVGGEDVKEITASIQDYLYQKAEVSETYFAHQEGMDFLTEFLAENKKGNSLAFATAGVMLYRMCNVPARYVEGYYVKVQEEEGSSEILLNDADVHYWVEIYLDGIGWAPAEMTPGFYEVDESLLTKQKEIQETPVPAPSGEEKQKPNVPIKKESRNIYLPILLGLGLLVLIGVVILILRRNYVIKKRLACFASEEALVTTSSMCRYLQHIMDFDGMKIDFSDAGAYRDRIKEIYGDEVAVSYENMINLLRGVRFGRHHLEPHEKFELKDFITRTADGIYEKADKKKRLIMKYIWCLK